MGRRKSLHLHPRKLRESDMVLEKVQWLVGSCGWMADLAQEFLVLALI